MTSQQIALVRETFAKVLPIQEAAAEMFYARGQGRVDSVLWPAGEVDEGRTRASGLGARRHHKGRQRERWG